MSELSLEKTKRQLNSVLNLAKSGHAKLDTIEKMIKDSRGVDPRFSHILMMGQYNAEKKYEEELNKQVLEKSASSLNSNDFEPEHLKAYLAQARVNEFNENYFMINHFVPEVEKYGEQFIKSNERLEYEMDKGLNLERNDSRILSKTKSILGFSR